MFVFNTDSWHYKIVFFVFGNSFFTIKKLDIEASVSSGDLIYKKDPKIINLCPYCRALVAAISLLPFVWVSKKISRKKSKDLSYEERMAQIERRSKIIRWSCASVNFALGAKNILFGEYIFAAINIAVGLVLLYNKPIFSWIIKHWPKRKSKPKKKSSIKPKKNPSLIRVYLESNHDKICPPIAFVDKNDTEVRR